jgi:molybdate transport system substrate-binding protein
MIGRGLRATVLVEPLRSLMRLMRPIAVVACVLLALSGCESSGVTPSSAPPSGVVSVMAAASLSDVLTALGKDFEAAYPGTRVALSFGDGPALARQIAAGASVDVFAAASPDPMATLAAAKLANGDPDVFAHSQLVIAVAPGDPEQIGSLADLARPGLRVALCAPDLPCGVAARTALGVANVSVNAVTLVPDGTTALSTVERGAADAALVYRGDARRTNGRVDAVEFPESAQALADYPVVALAHAPNPSGATAFVRFLRSPAAGTRLLDAGFQTP